MSGSSNPVSDSPGFKSNTGFYVEKDTLLVECMWRGGKGASKGTPKQEIS